MKTGFIFTDTISLGGTLGATPERVQEVLQGFVRDCYRYIRWIVVDVADTTYAGGLDADDWLTYSAVLNDYYVGLGLEGQHDIPLFIIGGVSEIPMPKIKNPITYFGGQFLLSDSLYGYTIRDYEYEVHYEDLINKQARYSTGRLPCCNGHRIEYVENYLKNVAKYLPSGIHIRGAAMTTAQSFAAISKEMMRDIPTVLLDTQYVPIDERMIVSPDLDTTVDEMYYGYVHEIPKYDFMVCSLHGSDKEGVPCFLGESRDHTQYIATQPSMFENTKAPLIFSTIACHGARWAGCQETGWVDYQIDDSMLLTTMRNGTMLYTGSCDTAIGGIDMLRFSNVLLRAYNIYLHQGMTAGEALNKAKHDYYVFRYNDDEDADAMFTILEFNLYGCPILHIQKILPDNYNPFPYNLGYSVRKNTTYKLIEAVDEVQDAYSTDDVFAYVRKRVDDNLSLIKEKIEKEVYRRLGLGKERLKRTYRLKQENESIGWKLVYRGSGENNPIQVDYYVDADNSGNIKRIYHTN